MRAIRTALLILLVLGPAALTATWAYSEGSRFGGGWSGLVPIWPYVVGGVAAVGLLAGGLMALAFFSAKRGYDEPYDVDDPPGPRP